MKIADLPLEERPREKAMRFGIGSLSDAEVLALLLGKGSQGVSALELSYRILNDFGSLSSLCEASLPELSRYPGIKGVKGLTMLAVFEAAKRIHLQQERYLAYSPENLHRYLKRKEGENEKAFVFALDGRGKVKGEKLLCEGSRDALALQSKDVLSAVMRLGTSRFVLAHTHPSGMPLPSSGDIAFTEKLRQESDSLSLRFVDHLIHSSDSYYSFSESGRL